MKVIGLNGSQNKNGNTAKMLDVLGEELKTYNIQFERINVVDSLKGVKTPFCVNCSSPCSKACFKDTSLEETFQKITDAEVLVVGSPVYFGTVSGQLKAFWDKTRGIRQNKTWVGKKAASLSSGHSKYGGQEMTLNTINTMLMVQGCTILNDGSVEFGAGHFGVASSGNFEEDTFAKDRIKVLASRIAEELKK